jgi:hypothetical protein
MYPDARRQIARVLGEIDAGSKYAAERMRTDENQTESV